MADETGVQPRPAEEPEVDGPQAAGVLASRSKAADRMFRGGVTSLVGGVMFTVGYTLLGLSSPLGLAAVIGGLVVGGAGLSWLGSAARHLFRYGSTRGGLILTGTTGLGVAALLVGLTSIYPAFGIGPLLNGLEFWAWVAGFGFAAFIVLLTLGALIRIIIPSDE